MLAYSIGSYRAQTPVGDRKSGMPLAVLTPAPVSATQGWESRTSAARRVAKSRTGLRRLLRGRGDAPPFGNGRELVDGAVEQGDAGACDRVSGGRGEDELAG